MCPCTVHRVSKAKGNKNMIILIIYGTTIPECRSQPPHCESKTLCRPLPPVLIAHTHIIAHICLSSFKTRHHICPFLLLLRTWFFSTFIPYLLTFFVVCSHFGWGGCFASIVFTLGSHAWLVSVPLSKMWVKSASRMLVTLIHNLVTALYIFMLLVFVLAIRWS